MASISDRSLNSTAPQNRSKKLQKKGAQEQPANTSSACGRVGDVLWKGAKAATYLLAAVSIPSAAAASRKGLEMPASGGRALRQAGPFDFAAPLSQAQAWAPGQNISDDVVGVNQEFTAPFPARLSENQPTYNSTIDGVYFCEPEATSDSPQLWVTDMTDAQLEAYATAALPLINHGLVVSHYKINHNDAFTFFEAHNRYIQCFKNALAKAGVKLPMWRPDTAIPPRIQGTKQSPESCDLAPDCDEGWDDTGIENVNPSISTPDAISPDSLCSINSIDDLFQLTSGWHGTVHETVGVEGAFATFDSPAALAFFPWHQYINTMIYRPWKNCPTASSIPAAFSPPR